MPTTTRVRLKVVKGILKNGIPLNRSEYFQDVFEEKSYSLNPQSNTRQLVPFILKEELKLVAKELPRKGGGVTSYNGLYGKAPPERGTFFTLEVYEKVRISRVGVYERVGKSIIYVFKRAFHQNISNTHTL